MRTTLAALTFAVLAAADPVPQGVTSAVAPSGTPPSGCSENYDGVFQITPEDVNTRRSLDKRQNAALGITLVNGILTDPVGRTGYVASNSQFQFDDPPQAGAIYTAGFSICANGSLAIGADTTWYKCLSGTFFNLYLDNDAGQCQECYLMASRVGGEPSGTFTTTIAGIGQTTITGQATGAVATNGSITTSTFSGNTSTLSYDATAGRNTSTITSSTGTKKTTVTGAVVTTKPNGQTVTTTGGQQTTGGGQGTAGASASASSSTGAAEVVGPVGGSIGFVAGLLALLAI